MSEMTPEDRGIHAAPERLLPAVTAAPAPVAVPKASALSLHPKTTGSGLMACLALIILYAVSYWIVVPAEVAAAFTSVLGFAGAYLAPWVESIQPGVE